MKKRWDGCKLECVLTEIRRSSLSVRTLLCWTISWRSMDPTFLSYLEMVSDCSIPHSAKGGMWSRSWILWCLILCTGRPDRVKT